EQNRLRSRLRDLLRRDVDLTFHTTPELLAGLQIRIGSTVFDSTVRGRLTAMQGVLSKEERMRIKADEISAIIKEKIKGVEQQVDVNETGSVIQVGHGIAKIYGLDGVM